MGVIAFSRAATLWFTWSYMLLTIPPFPAVGYLIVTITEKPGRCVYIVICALRGCPERLRPCLSLKLLFGCFKSNMVKHFKCIAFFFTAQSFFGLYPLRPLLRRNVRTGTKIWESSTWNWLLRLRGTMSWPESEPKRVRKGPRAELWILPAEGNVIAPHYHNVKLLGCECLGREGSEPKRELWVGMGVAIWQRGGFSQGGAAEASMS